jgi:hypothetical protein
MRGLFVVTCTLLLGGCIASTAFATPLAPNTVVAVGAGDATGSVLADTGLESFSFSTGAGLNSGTVREIIVADAFNPFGAGDLTFILQVTQNTLGTEHVSTSSFGNFLTDVTQAPPHSPFLTTGTHTASTATRDFFGTVEFDYPVPNELLPGQTTLDFLIRTNATQFQGGTVGLIDGGGTTVQGFSLVPEPAAIFLLGSGLLGGALHLRSRKKNASKG